MPDEIRPLMPEEMDALARSLSKFDYLNDLYAVEIGGSIWQSVGMLRRVLATVRDRERRQLYLCPVHADLAARGQLVPVLSCYGCLRNERDELQRKLEEANYNYLGAQAAIRVVLPEMQREHDAGDGHFSTAQVAELRRIVEGKP